MVVADRQKERAIDDHLEPAGGPWRAREALDSERGYCSSCGAFLIDLEYAADCFHRAVQKNSKDARVHFYYAMMLQQQGSFQDSRSGEFKQELEAAIALHPTFADAYSMLGFAQASSGEPEKGIATMKQAIELSPRNET